MQKLSLNLDAAAEPWVLCLGAHSDDIEIGAGGTILRLVQDCPQLRFCWVVFSATGARAAEAKASALDFLHGAAACEIVTLAFRDGYFPYVGAEIKDYFETLKRIDPALVFTHYREDLHQDHRVINELTWNTFRNHLILEYEIPKYDGGLGSPSLFVPVPRDVVDQKCSLIVRHFQTQSNKHWFTEETFAAVSRLRGIEAKATDGYAEAFYVRKLVI